LTYDAAPQRGDARRRAAYCGMMRPFAAKTTQRAAEIKRRVISASDAVLRRAVPCGVVYD